MTEKRYYLNDKFNTVKGYEFIEDGTLGLEYTVKETVDKLNRLTKENDNLYETFMAHIRDNKKKTGKIITLMEENKQLQSELSRYKEVNRLDIWKSSYSSEDALITELQDKCDKKQEHIVILENKIHRMREAIHKLEWLATHRNGELIRENEQLYELINFANTLIAFKSSESCQKEWEKRLKELQE